jgi:hypothetical protein
MRLTRVFGRPGGTRTTTRGLKERPSQYSLARPGSVTNADVPTRGPRSSPVDTPMRGNPIGLRPGHRRRHAERGTGGNHRNPDRRAAALASGTERHRPRQVPHRGAGSGVGAGRGTGGAGQDQGGRDLTRLSVVLSGADLLRSQVSLIVSVNTAGGFGRISVGSDS